MTTDVRDNPAEHRFEIEQDGAVAFTSYERRGPAIVFLHTEVPQALAGRGIASRLVGQALVQVRGRGLKVVPECSFVASYMERHPETHDLRP